MAFHVFGVRGHPSRADFSGYHNLVSRRFSRPAASAESAIPVARCESFLDPKRWTCSTRRRSLAWQDVHRQSARRPDGERHRRCPGRRHHRRRWPRTVRGGLHAKLFVAERARRAHLFLGSANATDPAFTGNVEILVELIGSTKSLGVDALLDKNSLAPILEPYAADGGERPDPADEARRDLDQFLRQVAAITLDAEVVDEGPTAIGVHFSGTRTVSVPAGYEVALELHTRPALASHLSDGDTIDVTFGPMPLADITPFLTVLVTTGEGIRGGAVLIANSDQRPAWPVRRDPRQATRHPGEVPAVPGAAPGLGRSGAASASAGGRGLRDLGGSGSRPTGMFELMVRALADKPGALDTLAELIPRLAGNPEQASPLPDGFLQLWDAVNRARLDTEDAAR